MNKPRLMLLAGAVVLVVAGALLLVQQNAPRRGMDAASTSTATPAADDKAATASSPAANATGNAESAAPASSDTASTTAARLPPDLPPMPAADLPLSMQLDALVKRATAGDGDAACRILLEGNQCAEFQRKQRFVEATIRGRAKVNSSTGEDLSVDLAAKLSLQAEPLAAHCEGIDLGELPVADELLANLLPHLSPRQKAVLALSRLDGGIARLPIGMPSQYTTGGSPQQLIPQILSDHHRRLLEEAASAGDELAIEGLVLLHNPSSIATGMTGMRFAAPDQHRFAVNARALLELQGAGALGPMYSATLDAVFDAMSAPTRARVESDVAALVARARLAQGSSRASPARDARPAELCAD